MVAIHAASPRADYAARELLAAYDSTSARTRRRGRQWYPTAKRTLRAIANETGYTLEQATAVLAITSPGAQLATNFAWTERALRSKGRAKVGRFPNTIRPKIRAALSDPMSCRDWARGPKVSAFHRAILGDRSSVVVDRWAYRAATGASPEATAVDAGSVGRMAELTAAYQRAASIAGEHVRDFQAIVWLHVRETTPDALGRVRRLQDITKGAR